MKAQRRGGWWTCRMTALAVCCAAVTTHCSAPTIGVPVAGGTVTTTTTTLLIPSVSAPTGQHCGSIKVAGTCQEWTPLDPQPSFADMIRLIDQARETQTHGPGGLSWGGLYLCGAMPSDLLTRYLGDHVPVILNRHICSFRSADGSKSLDIYVGDEPPEAWAAQFDKDITEVAGRPAVNTVDEEIYSYRLGWVLGLPHVEDHVLVVKIDFAPVYSSSSEYDPEPPDQNAARALFTAVADILIDLSN